VARKRLILVVLFSGFVFSVFAVPRVTSWVHQGDPGGEYGFHLKESAHSLGIDFIHEASSFDPKIENITPWIQGMHGASVAVCDFNDDGWPDIYVTNGKVGSKNRLYINRGGKLFEEVAEKAGVADVNRPGTGISTGAACADLSERPATIRAPSIKMTATMTVEMSTLRLSKTSRSFACMETSLLSCLFN